MPGSSTTPGRLGARVHAPIRVAFRIRNGVGTRDNNLCEAQWLACAFPYRRFAAALTDDRARLGADVVSYSFTVSDLHRLLVAGLPAHCERFWTLPLRYDVAQREPLRVTEPAHLFRRGGSLRFTIASLESLAPTIHACCPTHSSSTDEISSISSVVIFTCQPILRPNGFLSNDS
jgi:hypothetical protein